MKNKSIWKWALCGIGVLLLLGAASHFIGNAFGHTGFGARSFGHGPGGDMLPHKLRGGFEGEGIAGGHGGGAGLGGHPLLSILLPIGLLIGGALAYVYYRTRKQSRAWGGPSVGQASPVIIPVEPIYTENLDNAQILDEWEQNTLKEDK